MGTDPLHVYRKPQDQSLVPQGLENTSKALENGYPFTGSTGLVGPSDDPGVRTEDASSICTPCQAG